MAKEYALGMRTTVDLPEDLLEEARRATDSKTMRETIVRGLEELIKKSKREELLQLAGKIQIDFDPSISRSRGRK
jgi:Arc/MetJ family transcription regulator